MDDISVLFAHWQITPAHAREQICRAATPRERERWHALWLRSQDCSAAQVARARERDSHTIGEWLSAFARQGPAALAFEQNGGSPPPSSQSSKRL